MAQQRQRKRGARSPKGEDERCPVCFAYLRDVKWAGRLRVCDSYGGDGGYKRRLMCGSTECMRRASAVRVYVGRSLGDFTDLNSLLGWSNWCEDIGVTLDIAILQGKYGKVLRHGEERADVIE